LFWCVVVFCWYRPYCTDLYRLYNSKLGHGNRGSLLHVFQGIDFFLSFLKEVNRTGRGYNSLFWAHFTRCCFQQIHTVVWTVARKGICGDRFCVVSGFSLGWKCVIAAVMYFPEAE
jgi:hypothetical protein